MENSLSACKTYLSQPTKSTEENLTSDRRKFIHCIRQLLICKTYPISKISKSTYKIYKREICSKVKRTISKHSQNQPKTQNIQYKVFIRRAENCSLQLSRYETHPIKTNPQNVIESFNRTDCTFVHTSELHL